MPEELPSAADLRQCIEALNKPIAPYCPKYRQAKTGDVIDLGEHKADSWHPAPQGGIYFKTMNNEFSYLDLNGQEKHFGQYESFNWWWPDNEGGIYFWKFEDEFFYFNLNGQEKHLRKLSSRRAIKWHPAPQGGIYFSNYDSLFHLDLNDQEKCVSDKHGSIDWYPDPKGVVYSYQGDSRFSYVDLECQENVFCSRAIYEIHSWRPDPQGGVYFQKFNDGFFHLDLGGREKLLGVHSCLDSWSACYYGGINFQIDSNELLHLDLNGKTSYLGKCKSRNWHPAPQGICFYEEGHFYLLVIKDPITAAPA